MNWNELAKKLSNGETIEFRPRGNSMTPRIISGQLVKVVPVTEETELKKGQAVLCKVRGNFYLHLIKAIQGNRYQIGNNHGRINGWTPREKVFGIAQV